jgi:hypothetical protein
MEDILVNPLITKVLSSYNPVILIVEDILIINIIRN